MTDREQLDAEFGSEMEIVLQTKQPLTRSVQLMQRAGAKGRSRAAFGWRRTSPSGRQRSLRG